MIPLFWGSMELQPDGSYRWAHNPSLAMSADKQYQHTFPQLGEPVEAQQENTMNETRP